MKKANSNNTDLEAVRKLIKTKVIEWTKDGIELRDIAVDYCDLNNDLLYTVMLNEEISYKFHAVMKTLPSEQDVETLIVIHTKMMKAETTQDGAEYQKQEIDKLEVLLEAIQKFNKV